MASAPKHEPVLVRLALAVLHHVAVDQELRPGFRRGCGGQGGGCGRGLPAAAGEPGGGDEAGERLAAHGVQQAHGVSSWRRVAPSYPGRSALYMADRFPSPGQGGVAAGPVWMSTNTVMPQRRAARPASSSVRRTG